MLYRAPYHAIHTQIHIARGRGTGAMDMMAFRFDICDNFTAVDAAIGMFYFYFDLYFLFFFVFLNHVWISWPSVLTFVTTLMRWTRLVVMFSFYFFLFLFFNAPFSDLLVFFLFFL